MENTQSIFPEFKGFVSGIIGGLLCVIVGQPFDIVKVRLQNYGGSALHTFIDIGKKEGIKAFWKGSLPPLIGVGFEYSIVFGVVENCKRWVSRYNEPGEVLSIPQHAFCGAWSGAVSAIASTPAEHLRIRMQVQGKINTYGDPFYKSSVDCASWIFKNHGIKGIFKAFYPTIIRDTIGMTTYFIIYQGMARKVFGDDHTNAEDLDLIRAGICGGTAGFAFWIPIYPLDSIKSRLQCDSFTNPMYKSTYDCFTKSIKKEGISCLFKGITPCLLRAFPVNAAIILGFEASMSLFGRDYR